MRCNLRLRMDAGGELTGVVSYRLFELGGMMALGPGSYLAGKMATELLGNGASFEDVPVILGNSPEIVRKHYAKWSLARQARIDDPMERVHVGKDWTILEMTRPQ